MEIQKKEFKKLVTLILVAVISFWVVTNLRTIGEFLGKAFSIISPFIIGGCLAFVLNIPMSFFERKIKEVRKNKNKDSKWIRILSLIFAFIVVILVLTIIITLIVPELIDIINLLIKNIPVYIDNVNEFIQNNSSNLTEVSIWIEKQNINVETIKDNLINQIPNILTSSLTIVGSIINGLASFFIAIVFAVYILIDKEKLQRQAKKLITAYLKKDKVEKIVEFFKVANHTFRSFLTVQCLEAAILGMLCIIGMLILQIPYAVPIGVLIGVTALIPVVGAFIGIVVGAILILSVSPIKMLTFIIFVLILQQIEGNLIYPRVVGKSVGLPGMWVLLAVSIGGSLGGVFGMLLGVPVVSIMYTLIKNNVNNRINSKENTIN